MPEKKTFIHKVLGRVERMDPKALQDQIQNLAAEASLTRLILDSVPEAILLFGKEGDLKYFNRPAAHWLGIPEDTRLPRHNSGELIRDESVRAFFLKRIAANPQQTVESLRLFEPRQMDLRAALSPLAGGEGRDWILILTPSSEHQGDYQNRQMLARHESLLRLAAGVAHEIGNPLNAIAIHLELLKKNVERSTDEKMRKISQSVTILRNETARLDRIVKNFLRATRKPPLRFKLEDLHQTIAAALDFLKPEFDRNRIRIKFRESQTLAPFLFDRSRMYEAFMNLLKNAMEAMPGGGKITVSLTHKVKWVMVQIRDEGPGIPDEDLPHIFEAYYTTKDEGSGLGLWMVYQAVAEHGGRIDVATGENKGTTFNVILPIHREKLRLPNYDLKADLSRQKG